MADKKEDKKDENTEVQPDAVAAKSKKKRLIIMGGLGGLLVVGAAVGIYLTTSGGGKKVEHAEVVSAEESKETEKPAEDAAPHGDKKADATKDEKKAADEKVADKKGDDKKADDKKSAEAKPGSSDFGETHAFKTFHLNLGNPLENNYVRLEISVEYNGGQEQLEEIKKREPQLRDAVVNLASRKTREFLLSPDGKDQLRKDILTQFNRYLNKNITTVFITDLLIE